MTLQQGRKATSLNHCFHVGSRTRNIHIKANIVGFGAAIHFCKHGTAHKTYTTLLYPQKNRSGQQNPFRTAFQAFLYSLVLAPLPMIVCRSPPVAPNNWSWKMSESKDCSEKRTKLKAPAKAVIKPQVPATAPHRERDVEENRPDRARWVQPMAFHRTELLTQALAHPGQAHFLTARHI